MKAGVSHGVGNTRLDDVEEPKIQESREAAYPSGRCLSHKRDRRKSPSHRAGERGARG